MRWFSSTTTRFLSFPSPTSTAEGPAMVVGMTSPTGRLVAALDRFAMGLICGPANGTVAPWECCWAAANP